MDKKLNTFVTLFPYYEDFHFFKDPGQIPFRMKKLGYNVKLISFKNSVDYIFTNQFLQLDLLKEKKTNYILKYLIKNSNQIKVLNLFHISWITLLYSFIYKSINPKGIVYIKMDNNCFYLKYEWQLLLEQNIPIIHLKRKLKQKLFKYFFRTVDLFSVEDVESCKTFSSYNQIKDKIFVSYNGFTCDLILHEQKLNFHSKGNIILTVARLGVFPKNTQLLIEAFAEVAKQIPDWQLHLAGPVDDKFKPYLINFFEKNNEIKDRIIFHGNLNKRELFSLYNKSKIFLMPSTFEGFANVFSEALYFGNVIITTETVSPKELIRNKCGIILSEITSDCLAFELKKLIKNPELQELYSKNSYQISNQLNWEEIVKGINEKINQIRNKKSIFNVFHLLKIIFIALYISWLYLLELIKKIKS